MAAKLAHQDRQILLHTLSDAAPFATVRGRQSIVRNALAGYPFSSEVDKALRWIDWEGAAYVFVDNLLRLDGHEPAPGVPALSLIIQALEPMLEGAAREQLADLRRRYGWGTPEPAALPASDWRAPEPPSLEKIIGENTLRPLYYLRRALITADAVVRVDLNGTGSATGFLVAPDLMVTNHHVIANEAQARAARACFFDELPDEENKGELRRKQVTAPTAASSPLLYTNQELDVTLVRLEGAPPLQRYLPLRPVVPKRNDRVAIIQHPGGYPKQISMQNNFIADADEQILQYYTSTEAGSSGSPVLDDGFAVLAVHHSWVEHSARDAMGQERRKREPKEKEDLRCRNQGTSVIALLDDLKAKAPGLVEKLTILPKDAK